MIYKLIPILLVFAFVNLANAAYQRFPLKIKAPGQYILEKQTITAPSLAANIIILDDYAGATSSASVAASSFDEQPDVPRILSVQATHSYGDVAAGNVIITGTNIQGKTITDTFVFTADLSTAVVGTKAFKTVTKIVFPAEDSGYTADWDVIGTDKLGLDACYDKEADIGWASLNGTYETTRGTITVDADEVEKNVIDINGTLTGALNVEVYGVPNGVCKK